MDGGYDFVDVRDVAAGILACCERGRPGECYILSGRYCTVRDVLAMLHRITGRRRVRVMPVSYTHLPTPENIVKGVSVMAGVLAAQGL